MDLDERAILRKIIPGFQYRSEIYQETLRKYIYNKIWVDIGCGANEDVDQWGGSAAFAVGLDIVKHSNLRSSNRFIQSRMPQLPFPDNFAEIITLRLVVEHVPHANQLHEVFRVLRPGGYLIILTTNLWSPVVFLPKIFPQSLRTKLIHRFFNEPAPDIFPTYHALNTPGKIRNSFPNYALKELKMIEQASSDNPLLFALFLLPVIFTRSRKHQAYRSNILAVLQKRRN